MWSVAREHLPVMDRVAVQYVAYKDGKAFEAKSPALVEMKLDTTKFSKLHCFHTNRYFEGPVIALDVVRDDAPCVRRPLPEGRDIAEAMVRGARPKERREVPKPRVHERVRQDAF